MNLENACDVSIFLAIMKYFSKSILTFLCHPIFSLSVSCKKGILSDLSGRDLFQHLKRDAENGRALA